MARAWFFRVLLNSSSFSAILRSISCLTCPSSKGALSLLQPLLQLLLLRLQPPPLLVQLVDGAAAIAQLVEKILDLVRQVLFSRLTMSSCSLVSSNADFRRNLSALKFLHSEWQASSSAWRSSALAFHSPTTLSKLRPRFSVMQAAA